MIDTIKYQKVPQNKLGFGYYLVTIFQAFCSEVIQLLCMKRLILALLWEKNKIFKHGASRHFLIPFT